MQGQPPALLPKSSMAIASAITPTSGFRRLTDEDVPGGIARGLRKRNPGLDIVRVQEVGLMQSPDPDVLDWPLAKDGSLSRAMSVA